MAASECPSCGGKMNAQAVVCPHCGARRAKVTMADAKLSKDEIRALITTDHGNEVDDGRGLVATMFEPHPQTAGRSRKLEIALTVITAPLVATGLLGIVLGRARLRRKLLAAKGEAISALVMSFFGGIGLYSLLDALHAPAVPLTAISVVALWVRATIRGNAASWRRSRSPTRPSRPARACRSCRPRARSRHRRRSCARPRRSRRRSPSRRPPRAKNRDCCADVRLRSSP